MSDHHERNDAMDMATDLANDAVARAEMAMQLIAAYGGFDGAHHKQWVLDQVMRVLLGTQIDEESLCTGEPSPEYLAWAERQRWPDGRDGEEYDWDEGIAP